MRIITARFWGREDFKSMTFLLSQWLFTGGKFQWLNFLLFKDSFLTFKDSFSSFLKTYFRLNFNDSFSSFSITLFKWQDFNDFISPFWLNINDSFSTLSSITCFCLDIFLKQMIWLLFHNFKLFFKISWD